MCPKVRASKIELEELGGELLERKEELSGETAS